MTRVRPRGAPPPSPRFGERKPWLWVLALVGGCVYDWTVPSSDDGGATSSVVSTTTSSATSSSSSAGGAAGGGGEGASGGAGGMAPLACGDYPNCGGCVDCVYAMLPGATGQQCVLYGGCLLACGPDPVCQANCQTQFPDGFAVRTALDSECTDVCAAAPPCL